MAGPDNPRIGQLGWRQLTHQRWTDLVDRGLPIELVELIRVLGEWNERAIRLYTLPMVEAGIEGLAVPFDSDDGILFDPSLLNQPGEMTSVVARELAIMLYPGWGTAHPEDYEEMKAFASVLGEVLLHQLPKRVAEVVSMVEQTLEKVRR